MYTFKTKEELEGMIEDARTSAAFCPYQGSIPVPIAVGLTIPTARKIQDFCNDFISTGELGDCNTVVNYEGVICSVYIYVSLGEEERKVLLEQEKFLEGRIQKALDGMKDGDMDYLMRDLLEYDELLADLGEDDVFNNDR